MGVEDSNPLLGLYESNIGAASTGDEAYGYWLFVIGLFTAFLGLVVVLPTGAGDTVRGVGIGVAAIGLVLLLVGPVIRLPLPDTATTIAYVGALVSGLGAVWFTLDFSRGRWSSEFENSEPFILGLYGLGIFIIAVGSVVTPFLQEYREQQESNETAAPGEEQSDSDEGTGNGGDTGRTLLRTELQHIQHSRSQFELYEADNEHRWRLRRNNRDVVAESGQGYPSRREARQALSRVRRDVPGAALVEPDRAATVSGEGATAPQLTGDESRATFETYEDVNNRFRWRLRHDDDEILADSATAYASDTTRDRVVRYVRQFAQTADYLRLDPAAFEIARDRSGRFRWRLLYSDGTVLAEADEGCRSPQQARKRVAALRQAASEGPDAFGVDGDGDGFRWRLVSGNGTVVAESEKHYDSEQAAAEGIERLCWSAPDATVLDIGSAVFELYEDGDAYRWRLRHRNGSVLAVAGESFPSWSATSDSARSVKRNVPGADTEPVTE